MRFEDRVSILGKHADIMTDFYERINNYHKRPQHVAQITVARDYFTRGMRVVQSQWARDVGKTESALYISNVAAVLNDKFWVMIICPELKQGKKIYWNKKRLQNYAPEKYIKDVNVTDLRVEFHNGSLITVDGCENYEALRGVKPDLVIYDEFQHHSKEFHLEVMQPNLLKRSTSLLVYGTPPKNRSAYYVEFREQLLKQIKAGASDRSYYEFDTYANPIHDHKILAEVRKELIESDNMVIWQREYEGKLVFGGEDAVFPKWNPVNHVRTHKVVTSYVENDKHKLRWFTICDPGSSSVFAVLFICYNPYTQQIFIMDEIYEKDRLRTDTFQMWQRIIKKEEELFPHHKRGTFRRIYDEAALWFANEVRANFKESLIPSDKQRNDPEVDVSRIKMAMAQAGALVVSDRCYWLRWEVESYVTDEEGQYPKKHNHLIDDFRYFMQSSGWKLAEKADETLLHNTDQRSTVKKIEDNDWSENALENSLGGDLRDIYPEYFN